MKRVRALEVGVFNRNRKSWFRRLVVTLIGIGTSNVVAAFSSWFIIHYHHWNDRCLTWQWAQKINHVSFHRHPLNQGATKPYENVCFYHIKAIEHFDRRYNETTTNNNNVGTKSKYDNNKPRKTEKFYKEIDHTRLFKNVSSSQPISVTVASKRPQQGVNNNDSLAWYRAYQQIHAMLVDVRTVSSGQHDTILEPLDDLTASTHKVVLMVFEGFVRRLVQNYKVLQQQQQQPIQNVHHVTSLMEHDSFGPIEAIEDLLNEICTMKIMYTSPTLFTVENIWTIYQYDLREQQQRRQQQQLISPSHNGTKRTAPIHQTHAIRATNLLQNWIMWSNQYNTPLYQRPPPIHLIIQLFSYVNENGTAMMSTDLWSLYMSTITSDSYHCDNTQQWNKNVSQSHPRIQLDCIVLQILSKSGLEWEHYQCTILQTSVRSSLLRTQQRILQLYGGEQIFMRALLASAKVGRVADTAWLSRFILSSISTLPSIDKEVIVLLKSRLHMIHFESLFYSNDPGSLLYLERYIWENPDGCNSPPFNGTTCMMLLIKYSNTKYPSHLQQQFTIGRCAEKFLFRAYQTLYNTQWYPDADCARCVVEAYLPPIIETYQAHQRTTCLTLYLKQIRAAEHFIRVFIQQFGLRRRIMQQEYRNVTQYNSDPIFTRLFDAYSNVALLVSKENDTSVVTSLLQIAQQADTLFRFFVIQYRNGQINSTNEYPTLKHIEQLGGIFSLCTNATSSDNTATSASTTRQLFRNIDEYKSLSHKWMRNNNTTTTTPSSRPCCSEVI